MDQKLLFLINREWISPAADRVMVLASSWGFWMPLAVILILILSFLGGFRMRAFLITALIVVAVNDGLVARTLKRAFDRPRPHQALNDVRVLDFAKAKVQLLAIGKPLKIKMSSQALGDVDGRSFPSSHTMNLFSVAFVGACFFGWRAAWLFGVAALVAYSRMYVGAHWPSDVIISIFLAAGTSLLMVSGLNWLWRTRGAAWLPKIHAQHPTIFTA